MTQVAAMYSFTGANMASFMTGLGISSIVFLILSAQVWVYFWRHKIRSRENRQNNALVIFIWLIQAAQMVITTQLSRIHTMEFEDKSHFFGFMLTEWGIYIGIGSLTTSLVHGVFICRIFRLEKSLCGRRRMSFVSIAFLAMEQVFGLLSTICLFKLHDHPNYSAVVIWSILISLGCSAINDVLIAGTLAYILHTHRTVSPRTNQMITKLVIFCSQTGLITTVTAFITMGLWAACRLDINHLYMCFPIGGLYATCLLANFIARESYLQPQTVHQTENSEISFARFTQAIHVGLPDNHTGHQETLVMQGGTNSSKDSSKASSC
ncbi:uncharacterized protein BJ212DRAFT_1589452 [Suillus subaureus]|uniref:DUF6534 domain-containing protein n=1 Tax=Suillus subaureus TaxID=48587 RepID=A0A9P7E4X9_9AGAM|nr:uncharacterized protein BJ212DRAFT_1589452 [Suillus subaureus]KAG1811211.1 hypothetical protein BJ212DRAFT_1589452 [Suillus subaureus]